ncbi:TonB-dependent receptor [Tamlana sedimentorum]|uniref:TonB-dependent receptor n=1 Tax=Neotamlana sedimentorum TaxID=1435349 RepID=A0A0D7W8Q3_9FLAO|nr:TonB-dependent receptor [Tamlana sedimentorum]KJD35434.1 TonB-dependent receptor [Tamlana sedimentorum]
MLKTKLFVFILLINTIAAFSQATIKGQITDANNLPLEGASVILKAKTNLFTLTNSNGTFEIKKVPHDTYTLTISHLGYKTIIEDLIISENLTKNYVLKPDLLNLHTVVVTGNFTPKPQIKTSTSISTLNTNALKQVVPQGTANLLQNIPGTFADASAGEVFTRVYTRGISAAAEDDLGWYYVSLQEDGLPVSLVQHSYYGSDLFHRADITTQKVEALRGGNASITAMNAPGGIYNFISKKHSQTLSGEIQAQTGIQGDGNPIYRTDAFITSCFGDNWFFTAGGHYRHNEGARNTDFTFSKGGQFKFSLLKENSRGYFKLYGKYLNDKTNRYNGVAATNWNDPTPAFGFDFNTTTLMMPEFQANIPDGRNLNTTNSFDPSQGAHAKDLAVGFDFQQNLGNNWSVKNNIKFSFKEANWQTSISNAFVSISDPTVYYLVSNGNPFPVGQLVFKDTKTGNELATINNGGIFAGTGSQYISGSLPNDAVMGTSTWYKDNDANEIMQQLNFRKEFTTHDLNFGLASGFSDTSVFTQGSFAFSTYENNPRMLQVTLENPEDPVIALSDEYGVSNYGGLFFTNSRADISQIAVFANDHWQISKTLLLDLGLRFESIKHKGSNDMFEPYTSTGGLDGDETTAYDNNILQPTGERNTFNFTYNYLSYSGGLNYKLNEDAALFGRFSKGHKAPELNYYFNNFSNVPVNAEGEIQDITQIELGLKTSLKDFSFTTTLFWSELKNIGSTNFEFDSDNGSIFYTPIQNNTSRTIGLEWESVYSPINILAFRFNGVLQNPKASKWTVYDAAGTVDTSDDSTTNYSGNQLAFNPKLMFNLSAEFNKNKFSSFIKWQYMGKREGNVANAFQLDPYSTFNAGIGYKISKNLSANLLASNVFNSEGLANFFGANTFGANANGATQEYIDANPDASFVVVPILPRATMLQLNYVF